MMERQDVGERVIFVDDEEHLRLAVEQSLQLADLNVISLQDAETALALIGRSFPGVLVSDIRMQGMDGLTLMRRALEIDPEFPVVLVTGHGDVDLAVRTMREGAYDFIEKPFPPVRLVDTVRRALDKRRLTLENRALRSQVGGRDAIEARLGGRGAQIIAVRHQIRSVAQTQADVLIIGETGTGKEVAARALHRASARGEAPFIAINCAALPTELIESELFGHEAGAFVGATRSRYGRFEHAQGGTLFLDEIDSLPKSLQAKLLHVVQNRSVTRLGSNETIPLDVRFVAASKKDLAEEAAQDRFRSDLLYRLNVVTIRMPSLDARREDIPMLFTQLVQEACARAKRAAMDVPPRVLATIASRAWPGNVRELRNVAERFVLGLDLDLFEPGELAVDGSQKLADQMAMHEKSLIAATISAHNGNLKSTYEALGISRKSLYEKMQKHGLSKEDYRAAAMQLAQDTP